MRHHHAHSVIPAKAGIQVCFFLDPVFQRDDIACYNKAMDDFALGYLLHRFFYRIFDFFRHWYVGGSRIIAHAFISTLENIDRSLAVKITLQHFFEPLYKDYSVIGRLLGIIFRSFRVVFGILIYVAIAACFAVAYVAWILALPTLIFFSIRKL